VQWLERKKTAGGPLTTTLEPVPYRNKAPRRSLRDALQRLIEEDDWDFDAHVSTPADADAFETLLSALASNYYRIPTAPLIALADYLESKAADTTLITEIRDVAAHEALPHPHDEALEALAPRVPRFVRFGQEARDLQNGYDLSKVAEEPPTALNNLAELAGLDLIELRDKIRAEETGTVQDLIDNANETLRVRFEAWSQKPPVQVQLDHSGYELFVHVKSGTGATMRIRERSEGLRQFVALLTLTARQAHRVPPILLVDEIEMHLHYDAQADLMKVLARQTAASQVVYTTHSAACLPEDIGASVRVVKGDETMSSTVQQNFWSENPGLVPLLLAMGAGSLAFVPLRPAVIVEGGSDLVLLPTLLLEAIGDISLGFQVVPGAAEVPAQRIAGLDLQGVKTVWILDGDHGGYERRDFLVQNGVPEERVLFLETATKGFDLEDFVYASTYVSAVSAYARDIGVTEAFTLADLPSEPCGRHRTVVEWFEAQDGNPPGKTAIANKVLEFRGSRRIGEPRLQRTLQKIHREALSRLGA
jgi:hypothetical protein